MKPKLLPLLALALAAAGRAAGAASAEIAITTATKLEIVANGKPAGSIGLRPGDKVDLVDVEGETAVVRLRNMSGRVPLRHTDAANRSVTPLGGAPVAPAVRPSSAATTPPAAPAEPASPYAPQGVVERALAGKLVSLQGEVPRPRAADRLAGVKFFAFYYSASWCGPCRAFTPELADAYGKLRPLYPELEVVFVSSDTSAAEMAGYMREARMPWPALAWDAKKTTREATRHAGSGIPCLVLVDENGKVLSDSYRRGRYVGPDAVLDDTWKILREWRKKNPRPKG